MAQHATRIGSILVSAALLAVVSFGGNAAAQTVPPGKLPNIGNSQTTPSVPAGTVVCVAPMVKVGSTCQCPEGTVKTSPTTCALRAYVPLQKSNDD